jgi:hypothetical protein
MVNRGFQCRISGCDQLSAAFMKNLIQSLAQAKRAAEALTQGSSIAGYRPIGQ